jgi:hypothetical protein
MPQYCCSSSPELPEYLFAAWLSSARDTTPLAQICARVDGLQQGFSQEMREFNALVEQCRAALRDRADS